MSMTKACCTLPPVSSDYTPEGEVFSLGDLPIYETKDKSPKLVLICAYDIFGFHPNTKQFADKLNSCGMFRVVMPDFFRGEGLSMENFPPKDFSEIKKFVATKGSWEIAKRDMLNVIEHYKKEGVTNFGVFGFCWGGKMSIRASCEIDDVNASVLIHPSMVDNADAEGAKCPVLFIPTKDEPDMIPLYEIVKKNLGEDKTAHHRLDDVFHGFAGARGDWTDELQNQRVNETISLTHSFFKKHLSKN
ncbi:putative AIM2 family protein C30D10.14 [Orchesella cincta]|uniref:Putative AIM2 family protein C30D10.14 n=1 Tax=Orchesella cincta TaxID=48709 RepID=A0A1D2N1F7_ORCCI|nr:putative AIM2 family protein C30D10.14 [Orchesella cincta]